MQVSVDYHMAAVERTLAKVASKVSEVALVAHPHPADNGSMAIAALETTVGFLMTENLAAQVLLWLWLLLC